MVQAAESGHRYNAKPAAGTRFCRTAGRRFLHQRKMSSVIVVILDVFIHQARQVTFVDRNHMVVSAMRTASCLALGKEAQL